MSSPGPGYLRSPQFAFHWANALDFGVRADGQVDDSAALLRLFDILLADSGGGVVVLPPSALGYQLSQNVDVPAGITVMLSTGARFPTANLVAAGGSIWNLAETPLTETGAEVIARSAASVTLTPQALTNGVLATLAESGFTTQGSDITFNASNQLVVQVAGFYIVWANVLTTRSGGAATTGYATLLINGTGGYGVGAFNTSNTNEEIATAVAVVFINAGATVEVGAMVFNPNVSVTRGALGIGAF